MVSKRSGCFNRGALFFITICYLDSLLFRLLLVR